MITIIKSWFIKKKNINTSPKEKVNISNEIKMSLKKYSETYKLLGEYDKSSTKDPQIVAKPGRLRNFIPRLRGYPHSGGANPAI